MKVFYPAIFINNGDGFTVEFSDLQGCITEGASFEEAFEMAKNDAYGWILYLPENSMMPLKISETFANIANVADVRYNA